MITINALPGGRGRIDQRMLIAIAIGAVVIVAGAIWLLKREPEPEPVPAPSPTTVRPLETVEPAESPAERGDAAREIIEELESATAGVNYADAYSRAQGFRAEGRYADAQLLYFFAARGGHAPAAFDLAAFYDPVHFAPGRGLLDKPDPFQAYRWYRAARDAGHETAAERLGELRSWAEQAAADGDAAARRLLLQWEE